MDLTWTAGERAFRTDVQSFLQAKLPADLRAKTFAHQRLKREDYIRWHRILAGTGLGCADLAEGVWRHRLEPPAAPDL